MAKHDRIKPYRFSFTAQGKRHVWIRFYDDMGDALNNCKEVAMREYTDAKAFVIESDQDDEAIRKAWGL